MSYQPKEGDLVKLKKDFKYGTNWRGTSKVIPAGTFGEIFERGVLAQAQGEPKITYNIIFYKCQPQTTWPIDEHTRRDQTDPVVMSANLLKVPNFSWDPPPDAAQKTYHDATTMSAAAGDKAPKRAVIVPVTSKSGGRKRKTKRKPKKRHRRKTRKKRKRRVKKRRKTKRR